MDITLGIRRGDPQKKNLLFDNHSHVIGIQHEGVDAEQQVLGIRHVAPNLTYTDLDTPLGIRRSAPHNPVTDRHSLAIGIRPEGVEQTLGNHRPASSREALGIRRQSPVAGEPQLPIGFESMPELPLVDVTNLNSQEAPPPTSDHSSTDAQTGVLNPPSTAEIARANYHRHPVPTDPTLTHADLAMRQIQDQFRNRRTASALTAPEIPSASDSSFEMMPPSRPPLSSLPQSAQIKASLLATLAPSLTRDPSLANTEDAAALAIPPAAPAEFAPLPGVTQCD